MKKSRCALFVLVYSALCFHAVAQDTPVLYDSVPGEWSVVPGVDAPQMSIDDNWWTNFEDSLLDSLVVAGINANYDIRMASRRVAVARAQIKAAKADMYPDFDAFAGWQAKRDAGRRKGASESSSDLNYWKLGVDMSWQVDLFGKISSQVDVRKDLFKATRAEWAGVMLSVAGEIVSNYANIRHAQEQLEILRERSASQQQIMRMVESRKKSDLASELDLGQARTIYRSTIAGIPVSEHEVRVSVNALAVILGVYPEQIETQLKVEGKIPWPAYRQLVTVGIPAEVLRRRPDVVEAEKMIASYAAALGVAKKEFLPNLYIRGSISTNSRDLGGMFSGRSYGWEFMPTLTWNIFDGFKRRAGVEIARETLQEGIDNYNFTILNAYQEANNALSAYGASIERIDLLESAVKEARRTLTIALDRYKVGLAAFSNVVDAEIALYNQQCELASAKRDALGHLVQLYTALGGGWDETSIDEI